MIELSDEARYAILKMYELGVTSKANLGVVKKGDDPAVMELSKYNLIDTKNISQPGGEVMVRLNDKGVQEYQQNKEAGVYSAEWKSYVEMILAKGRPSHIN